MRSTLFFDEALLRLKQKLGATEDQQIADLLGLKKAAFSARKSRNSFPEKELRALAQQRPDLGIDVDHVLTGVSTAVASATTVLRESTEQVMQLGLPSTESIAVRDIVYGVRTGNRQLVEDGIALLSAGISIANSPRASSKPSHPSDGVSMGNMTNHAPGGVQVGYAGGNVTSKAVTKVKKPKE